MKDLIHSCNIPLLQLHALSPTRVDHTPFTLPDVKGCQFNVRSVNVARLTCCDQKHDMLGKLRNEGVDEVASVMQGDVVGVFTSFDEKKPGTGESLPMNSVTYPEDSPLFHAIPLTKEVLSQACRWMRGKQNITEASDHGKSNMELLKEYLKLLDDNMPRNMSLEDLLTFYENHDWSRDGDLRDQCDRLVRNFRERRRAPLLHHFNDIAAIDDAYTLRRFIHENLAYETKVIVHLVDGIHRVVAIDCALTGVSTKSGDEASIEEYARVSPHKDKKTAMTTFLPKVTDEKLLRYMQKKSSQIQLSVGSQVPHNIRDVIYDVLTRLSEGTSVPQLWKCLGVVYRVVASDRDIRNIPVSLEDIAVMTAGICDSQDGQGVLRDIHALREQGGISEPKQYDIIEKYIACWVESMSTEIIRILRSSIHKHWFDELSSGDEVDAYKSTNICFKRAKTRAEFQFNLSPWMQKNMQLSSFIKKDLWSLVWMTGTVDGYNSFVRIDRFGRRPHTDVTFVVCQILLWSWTCQRTQSNLTQLFSTPKPEYQQYTPGKLEDAYRWTMNFFHNVCESVSKSYSLWKKCYFIPHRMHPIQCNPEQVILLCLLGSAIQASSEFFVAIGIKPTWENTWPTGSTSLLPDLAKRLGGNTIPDLGTVITMSLSLRMSACDTTKSDQVDRLVRAFGRGVRRTHKTTDKSPLSEETIDGNRTADPRSSHGNFLIAIVSDQTTSQILGQCEGDEALYTEDIRRHFIFMTGGTESIFTKTLQSLPHPFFDVDVDDDDDDDVDDVDADDVDDDGDVSDDDEDDMACNNQQDGGGGGGGGGGADGGADVRDDGGDGGDGGRSQPQPTDGGEMGGGGGGDGDESFSDRLRPRPQPQPAGGGDGGGDGEGGRKKKKKKKKRKENAKVKEKGMSKGRGLDNKGESNNDEEDSTDHVDDRGRQEDDPSSTSPASTPPRLSHAERDAEYLAKFLGILKLYEDVVEDDDGLSKSKTSIDKYKLELRRVRRRCSVDGCNSATCALSSSFCMVHMTTFIEQQESKGCRPSVLLENLKMVADGDAVMDEGYRLARVASTEPADTYVNASGNESNASHGHTNPELSIPDLSFNIDGSSDGDLSVSRAYILEGNHEILYHDEPVSQRALFAENEYLAARGSDTVDEGGGDEVLPPPFSPAQYDPEDFFGAAGDDRNNHGGDLPSVGREASSLLDKIMMGK